MAIEDIKRHLTDLSEKAMALEHRIEDAIERSDKSIALTNFCSYISAQLIQTSSFYPDNIAGLAWVTRNLFETNLIIRHVLTSEEGFAKWLGQSLRDEKDFIDGVLSIPVEIDNGVSDDLLRARLSSLHEMAQAHGLELSKPFNSTEIAKHLGLLEEYNALYKLCCKYVHPSSLLINAWHRQTPDANLIDVFLAKSQLYAGDSLHRVMQSCGLQSGAT